MSVIYGNPITLGGGGGKPKKLLSSLTEGSLVSVLEDGKLTQFYVAKHNYEADLNGEGRTLLVRKDLPPARVWHSSSVNAYATSSIDAWLNGEYKNSLSASVQGQLGATEFYYTAGNGVKTVSTLQRAVFMPSLTELGLSSYPDVNVEGSAFPIASMLQIAYLDGAAYNQWTRSPVITGTTNVAAVNGNGASASIAVTNTVRCPRPCFTLPANMALNTEPYADGSWGLADEDVLFDTKTAKTSPLAPVNYTNGIADLTPAQLHEIAAAISANPKITKDSSVVYYDSGNVHRKISTGDTQNITKNGASIVVNILGFNHDDLSWGTAYNTPTATGKAGMTIQTVDCTDTKSMNINYDNSTSWANSSMRIYSMPGLLAELSEELRGAIKTVKKLTSAGNKSSTITVTEDKLFLLSEIEVFGNVVYSFAGEGNQYAYYKAGNSKIKNKDGAAIAWWGRSPYALNAGEFCPVNADASHGHYNANGAIGVAFAYCI